MEFKKRKQAAMAAMASTEPDKSPKGTIDAPILELLNTLNLHPSYFTTSSCSGRISIFSHPKTSTSTSTTTPKKAKGGKWVFITHDRVDTNAVIDILFSADTSTVPFESDLVFRFEPFIVAVECMDMEAAQNLVSLAISSGFRESGITSVSSKRVIIAIRCSIRLEVPLGSSKMVLVSPDYVRYLVEIANEKMVANRKRTDGFLDALRRSGFSVGSELISPLSGEISDGDDELERTNFSTSGLPSGTPVYSLTVTPMKIVGESMEKLFLWGHSSCALVGDTYQDQLLIFGGFGGVGRHSRRNDCLMFNPITGSLCGFNTEGAPSPRLGHTCSAVGNSVFVIGGRADPVNILGDVWMLNTVTNRWKLVDCTGSAFGPRHRHASAVVGSKIFVFGGLNNDKIYSAMLVFDVERLQWRKIDARGEQPCARHSHAMVAHGSKIYMFGGYSGEKALGDLYTFDTNDSHWRKVKSEGEPPFARFSHSMFVYKDLLGIIGGCPIGQHCQELYLLDTKLCCWNHITLKSDGKDLFVRSTVTLMRDDLFVVGGGASCYAFGTKFSEPMKIDLHPLLKLVGTSTSCHVNEERTTTSCRWIVEEKEGDSETVQNGHDQSFYRKPVAGCELLVDVPCWALKLEKKYAKLGKDLLKKFGWLDLGRKAYSSDDTSHICFPVTAKFCDVFKEKVFHSGTYDINVLRTSCTKEISQSSALELLVACGATKHVDEVAEIRKAPSSPLALLREAVSSLIKEKGLPESLLHEVPKRWERLGDIVVLPISSFKDAMWSSLSHELWPIVARVLGARRLARQGKVAANGTRDSSLEILVGDNGWVEHCENGILYSFDATKCMFSWGNLSEKIRMARLDCRDEIVVDLFAGIGYFTLPFLNRANAKLVYACEWNPHAIVALRRNLVINSVSDRCIVLEGDNLQTAPERVANRVCLGLLPSSEGSWVTAVRALRDEGGILHIHGNAEDSKESSWAEHLLKSIQDIANSEGRNWVISLEHLERVKWYAPHIRHLVVDLRCSQDGLCPTAQACLETTKKFWYCKTVTKSVNEWKHSLFVSQ